MNKPLSLLNQNLNNRVIVALRGKIEYRGVLDGYDPHMNLVLKNVEEVVGEVTKGTLNTAVIRGDNVIYISI